MFIIYPWDVSGMVSIKHCQLSRAPSVVSTAVALEKHVLHTQMQLGVRFSQ
jgi:hypothetical protein